MAAENCQGRPRLGSEEVHMRRPHKWDDLQPIYRQLVDEVIAGILEKKFREGELLPSVRQLADTYQVNPLTAAKAYKELALDGFTETLRGEGLVVKPGVRAMLLKREQAKFMKEEWPWLLERIRRVEINLRDLVRSTSQ